jgi:Protein of unknown function (DUF2818)
MNTTVAVWLVLVVAILAANLPFLTERILLVGPRRVDKPFGWRLLELLLLGAATLVVGTALEIWIGQRAPQGWEFYAALGCLFLTLAFPGFVWRYLRRRRSEVAHEG